MPANLTEAEARALGLDVKAARKRTTRKEAKGPYHTRCCGCGEEFTVKARETEHVARGHTRFEAVL